MVLPHLTAGEVEYYQESGFNRISHLRGRTWSIVFLAIVGSLFVLQKRRWLSLYPVGWMIMGYLYISQITPAQNHHQLLATIPAAMLAGVAIGEVAGMIPGLIKSRKIFSYQALATAIVLTALFLMFMARIPWITQHPHTIRKIRETSPESQFLANMYQYAPQSKWIITDRPMFAFRVGLPVPPHIAVMTRKRVDTGYLTEEQVINAVKEWQPEQVLLGRFEFPTLERYLEQNYQLIHDQIDIQLYVRADMYKNN
ncbi:MAG: hypothetical protein PVF74_08820 [Anaerolineales bacterium]|jgi:hypothetical protein